MCPETEAKKVSDFSQGHSLVSASGIAAATFAGIVRSVSHRGAHSPTFGP